MNAPENRMVTFPVATESFTYDKIFILFSSASHRQPTIQERAEAHLQSWFCSRLCVSVIGICTIVVLLWLDGASRLSLKRIVPKMFEFNINSATVETHLVLYFKGFFLFLFNKIPKSSISSSLVCRGIDNV